MVCRRVTILNDRKKIAAHIHHRDRGVHERSFSNMNAMTFSGVPREGATFEALTLVRF